MKEKEELADLLKEDKKNDILQRRIPLYSSRLIGQILCSNFRNSVDITLVRFLALSDKSYTTSTLEPALDSLSYYAK